MKSKAGVGVALLLVVALILGVKAVQLDWFTPKTPLALNSQPALLFFNNDRGCDCALFVYHQAEAQISAWPEEKHSGIPVIALNLERRSDLVKEYRVVRAPTLLLLDSQGQIFWRQDEVVSDEYPLDLTALENKIEILKAGK